MHGVLLTDDYAWLRDKENPDVTAYLEAENAYAEAVMAPLAGLREELYKEMLSHVKQTDISVSYRDGDWWYYSRTEEGLQYGIFCRKRGGPAGPDADAAEEMVLDGNELAKGHAFFAIGDTDITDDGRWLAYSTDTTGFRQYTLRIKNLETGETLADEVERVGSVVWAADNRTLFYTVEDEQQKRQFQLWRHALSEKFADDVLVYQEDDERFNIAAGRTRDGKFIVIESASHTTSEARVLKADDPTSAFRIIALREDEHEYSLDHRNGLWFIRTNDRGRNFRLVTAPVESPGREHWTELIAHRDAIMLEDVDLFAGFFIACEREDGLSRLRLWKFSGAGREAGLAGEIAFPEPAYSAHPHVNHIFETTTFRYGYQSLVTPSSVYEYDTASGTSTLLKQLEIPGGFDRTLYASERIHATALRRHRRSHLRRLPQGQTSRTAGLQAGGSAGLPTRAQPAVCLRLRLLWLLASAGIQLQPIEPARSRRGHGLRAHPRGRRPRQAVARRRKNARQTKHVYRFHCLRGAPDRSRVRRPESRSH